ncbi:DUF2330 domain-containing protein [Myxococcota bacterium]|nr:DUF2330 domain-containing protein [Myxococcota bacterium]
MRTLPSFPRLLPGLATSLAALAAALAVPVPASACGGFFCEQVAVDQSAERILFEVHGDGTVTAVIEISYSGEPSGFSWVVPVSDTPTLDVVPGTALRVVDLATAPRIIPPNLDFGDLADDDSVSDDDTYTGDDDVDVEELPQVGPYEPTVVSSEDPAALVDWLNDNGYLVTAEMEPYVDGYVASGMKFLAMKLAPEAGVSDIQPISVTWPGDEPMIPLRLTGVAAEPEMGFIVFVLGEQRYGSSNYATLEVDDDLLRADPRNGWNNYFGLVSWQADQVGGQAFFTEYADDAPTTQDLVWWAPVGGWDDVEESRTWAAEAIGRHPYFTRLYARMSNWEMTQDPMFVPVDGGDVSNVHDLSGHPPVSFDASVTAEVPCAMTYCGLGGRCATTEEGFEGCVCDEGFVGRAIVAPVVGSLGSMETVACQDEDFDLLASLDPGDMPDPCAGVSCGDGTCVALGGFPHCACPDGQAAVGWGGLPACVHAKRTYGPEQLLWPEWDEDAGDDDTADDDAADDDAADDDASGDDPGAPGGCTPGCDAAGPTTPGALALSGLVGLLGARRRR